MERSEVFLRKGYLSQGLKEVREESMGKAEGRGNCTGEFPERKEPGVAGAERE